MTFNSINYFEGNSWSHCSSVPISWGWCAVSLTVGVTLLSSLVEHLAQSPDTNTNTHEHELAGKDSIIHMHVHVFAALHAHMHASSH